MIRPINFERWIERNREFLQPPVGNRHLFDEQTDMVIMVIGGPNQRTDYHDDPVSEFFYQVHGDMLLKIVDDGKFVDVPIRAGEMFYLPPHVRHSPQRPQANSVGLVIEGVRGPQDADGFEWFCFSCGTRVHRSEVLINDITSDLPPVFEAFYADETKRQCAQCNIVHPGKQVPPGWVTIES